MTPGESSHLGTGTVPVRVVVHRYRYVGMTSLEDGLHEGESVPSTGTGTPPGENVPIPGRPKILETLMYRY